MVGCVCVHIETLTRAVVEMIALAANLQVLASNTTLRETIQVAREEVRRRETGGGDRQEREVRKKEKQN